MKQFILILSLLHGSVLFGQNEYFSLTALWSTTFYPPPSPDNSGGYSSYYYTSGDTLIGDTNYVKCYRIGSITNYTWDPVEQEMIITTNVSGPGLYMLFRSEARKFYVRRTNTGPEKLMMDYNVPVDSTFTFTWLENEDQSMEFTVESIDSILINGSWRRAIHSTEGSSFFEGGGHNYGLNDWPIQGLGFQTSLNCYSYGNDNYHIVEENLEPISSPCVSFLGSEEIMSIPTCSIYPNPGDNKISLQNISYPALICFYSMDGMLVKTCQLSNQSSQIDVSDLPPGVYPVNIKFGDHYSFLRWVKCD